MKMSRKEKWQIFGLCVFIIVASSLLISVYAIGSFYADGTWK